MKQFVFLYPIAKIFNYEIKYYTQKFDKAEAKIYKKNYKLALNTCINARYRQNGFSINYAIFDDCSISKIINIHPTDKIFKVGLDFKTHTTIKSDGTYSYPNQDFILDQLNVRRILRIAGFHMWDCVEKLAQKAYEKGYDVMVDEDLTEFFAWRFQKSDFNINIYPSPMPLENDSFFYQSFIRARLNKPWLYQY